MRPRLTSLVLFVLLLVGMTGVRPGLAADVDLKQFQTDLNAIGSHTSRLVGSTGYNESFDYIQKQLADLPNVSVQVHSYDVMVPETTSATLSVDGGTTAVYPFFPAGIRLNSTPTEGISGPIIYCGSGEYAEIPPGAIRGAIAVIEGKLPSDWKAVSYFGARAVIVLGAGELSHTEFRSHEVNIPVNVPRFFLPDGPVAERLRKGGDITGRVDAKVNWRRKSARNVYAYVPPADPLPLANNESSRTWAALTVVVPVDAEGLVPDLSPAAGQAVQPAAALGMIRDYAARPPRRPMLFAFTGSDGFNLNGTRQMLMALADPPITWQEKLVEVQEQINAIAVDITLLKNIDSDPTRLNLVRDRTLISRIVKIIETDIALEQDELFRLRVLPPALVTDETTERTRDLENRQRNLGRLRYMFSSEPKKLAEFGDEAKKYVLQVKDRLGVGDGDGLQQQWARRRDQYQRRIDLYNWLCEKIDTASPASTPKSALRQPDPARPKSAPRLLEVLVGLDLSDRGTTAGPMYWGRVYDNSTIAQIQEYREWFDKLSTASDKAKGGAKAGKTAGGKASDTVDATDNPGNVGIPADAPHAWFNGVKASINLDPLRLARSPESYLNAPLGFPVELGTAWGVPAFSMVTLMDLRPRRDTPSDTLANLNIEAVGRQLQAVHTVLRHAVDDPSFLGQPEFRRSSNAFDGQVVSTASGRPIPDLPREGFLATFFYTTGDRKVPQLRSLSYAVGVRRIEVVDCDSEGRYFFDGMPRIGAMKQLSPKVYRLTPDTGRIDATSDLGKQSSEMTTTVNLDQTINSLKSLVFDCEEFTLLGLYDPRFLQSLGEVQLMDARRNAEPQRYNAAIAGQMLAGQLEPGTRAYLLFRYGRIGNRLILLNMPEKNVSDADRAGVRGEGRGYPVSEISTLGPLALVTATDFWRLNDTRIEQYRRAGVTSSLIDKMHADAAEEIDRANNSFEGKSSVPLMRHATGAWANEARVYDAAQKMANDVIYAAIFLLLLAVPFSFCMERLLIGTPNIYKQIAWSCFIFALMALALYLFHPAFKISSSPLIIILAFGIILMSLVVISVVYSKFDTELKRIRSGRGTAEGASFARASVLTSAVMLGIANMRRRKFRTALTSATVVLITFAVLCFTSSSRYQGTVALPTGVDASYPGLLLRQRGFRYLPAEALDSLHAVYADKKLVERWWTVTTNDKDQVNIATDSPNIANGSATAPKVVSLQALLGLTPGESDISPIAKVVTNFDRLENGESDIIYLAQATADQLKVKVGDTVRIAGIALSVAGTYDSNDFDQRATMLSGESVAPLKYSSGALDASGRALSDSAAESLDLDADSSAAEATIAYEHLPGSQFAIVPADVSRRLENTTLRTVAMRLAPSDAKPDERNAAVKEVVEDVTKRFALATFAGYSDGVKLVSASNLSSIGGGANVAIPLAIGGLIIFNTMMGSIAERRREIHVYTSLGLAPLHVGALFVAEAMTYGLIGSVFGYIIGQGVGTLLLKLGWLGTVTLNYSGTSAMLTLGLILLIVLLSALVPARLASKIAAPSIERSWRVPAAEDGQIVATLPFTINQTAAQGVIGYLAEFFEAHQEGSIGKFSAGKIEAFAGTDEQGRPTRGLKTVVWLTPFDLGVRQHLLLLIHPGEFKDIYEVQVVLERLSGDDGSWWRMNRSFLTELRKQFLQWRSLSPQRMKDYVDESRELFAEVPQQVVTLDTTEEARLA